MGDVDDVLDEDKELDSAPDLVGHTDLAERLTQQGGSGPSAATHDIAATGSSNTDAAGQAPLVKGCVSIAPRGMAGTLTLPTCREEHDAAKAASNNGPARSRYWLLPQGGVTGRRVVEHNFW